jgi:DNA mismatch repair protein MutL
MGKIVVLDENTSNKIAAGEVIERPASVIKELVENSIDAGSTSITVEVRNGGISYIKVTDNGSGIDEDDVEIAFERHSTSKIRSADDLDSITTMGFRGEALASIAAVSRVELVTRVPKNTHGTLIQMQGGSVKDVRQTGCPVGTTFIIRDLFFNTPARFKFLKKDTTEAGYISDTLSHIALGNPQISFRLISNHTSVLHTPGNNDLLSTIFSIYGKETSREVSQVEYQDNKIRITGYAGKPEIARSNRSHQSVYINRRYIKSKIITAAIDEAYKTLLLKNKFAFAVLNIEINPLLVDVNVHPAKTEVRFSDEQDIFRAVFHAISNALMGKSLIRSVELSDQDRNPFRFQQDKGGRPEFVQQPLPYKHDIPQRMKAPGQTGGANHTTYIPKNEITKPLPNDIFSLSKASETAVDDPTRDTVSSENTEIFHKEKPLTESKKDGERAKYPIQEKEEKIMIVSEVAGECAAESPVEQAPEQENKDSEMLLNARVIGQVFSTYILLQYENDMLLIDQHAAHERLMFEQLRKKHSVHESLTQYLIAPITLELTHKETKFLKEEEEFFHQIGYIYEDFGNNSIIIRAVPAAGESSSVRETFLEVLDNLMHAEKARNENVVDEMLYTIACKAAVKANQRLDEREIESLLRELSKLENPYTCPHGRPTIIRISKYELEKKFKRIV